MNKTAASSPWDKDRCHEFRLLESLINDCRSIDTGNGIIARLERISEVAAELTKDNLSVPRDSFLSFLKIQIIASRFPSK